MGKPWRALEEVAKFEQRIAVRRGKLLNLEKTEAFKSLSLGEKSEFSNYLKNKATKSKFFIGALILTLIGAIFFRNEITGGVVASSAANNTVSFVFILLFLFLILIFISSRIMEIKRREMFNRNIAVAKRYIN